MSDVKLTQAQLDSATDVWNRSRMIEHMGFTIRFPGDGTVVVALPSIQDFMLGGLGSDAVNGGVLASMFDFAIGCTAFLATPLKRNGTVQLSVSFEKAVRGNSARCVAHIERTTKTMLFCGATIHDETDAICGRGNGIVALGGPMVFEDWLRVINGNGGVV